MFFFSRSKQSLNTNNTCTFQLEVVCFSLLPATRTLSGQQQEKPPLFSLTLYASTL